MFRFESRLLRPMSLDEAGYDFIRSERSAIRLREGRPPSGQSGQCSIVASVVSQRFGFDMDAGFYIPNGHMGGACNHKDHVWNRMSDGKVFDATHDQFGQPDILIAPVDSPLYHSYCGSLDCPYCTCKECNYDMWEEAEASKRVTAASQDRHVRRSTIL